MLVVDLTIGIAGSKFDLDLGAVETATVFALLGILEQRADPTVVGAQQVLEGEQALADLVGRLRRWRGGL